MYETGEDVQGKLIMLEHSAPLTEVQTPCLSLSELSLVLQSVHQPSSPESLLQLKKPQILSLIITLNLQWERGKKKKKKNIHRTKSEIISLYHTMVQF